MHHITYSAGINLGSSHLYGSGDRLRSRFVVIFSFYKPICQKKILFHLEALHEQQLLAQVHPCSFFLQINSGPNAVRSLLSSLLHLLLLLFPLHWAHTRTPPLWHAGLLGLWWHGKAQFCRQQHDYGEGEGEVEQMCFNTSFFVFMTVP